MSFVVQLGVRLRNIVVILLVCSEVLNLVRYAGILRIGLVNKTVRRLDKTVLIDARV